MQVTGARVICVRVCGNVQEEMCAERAGVVCRNVHIACVGRACGMCEVCIRCACDVHIVRYAFEWLATSNCNFLMALRRWM